MARRHGAILLALLVLVAGCSGAGGGGASVDAGADAGAEQRAAGDAEVSEAESVADGGDGGGDPVARAANRQLVHTATVELRVDGYDRARERLTGAAERRGGFVSNANSRRRPTGAGNYTTGTVTYRVPADEYEAFLETVNETGTVVSSSQQTEDVTEQVVDLEARLRTLRAQRDRLRELYEQADDTEEVLSVERRLSDVQTEIERAEARKASLERQVALATVTVELREPRPDGPSPSAWYDTPLVEAFFSSVGGVVVTLRAAAVATAYVAPYLLVFLGPPVAGVVLAWRRWGGRGSTDDLGLDDAGAEPVDDGSTEQRDPADRTDDGDEADETT
ncbi:MAG: Zn-ribbon protein [uncultured archaeon A07HB70]|nr:MAG: Zn-ribbon protein [uncultured archaeon A07HB70]